ncbi:DUF5994 family protein [Kibdelosporangium phytohabitans]|uniref:Uncharacterized protein n=1 Tax=Kibdelosporangium phytohabitans TaxID=860235 RepID=A0A0N9HQH4_9PSEU|nr:DUF5994 family protein [Kibdelosporangium phytohabitans]ALG06972.1 hypothetical protein AOZ06_08570 [Kibdelosporangium phytohabitans]MBE1468252.1 hypothetical protein [Kibdelosporangium phytohabitans]
MSYDLNSGPAAPLSPPRELRLQVRSRAAALGHVDGAWWPRSADPASEFPALIMALSSWGGPARHMAYHLDDWGPAESTLIVENWAVNLVGSRATPAHTVVVTGLNLERIRLLVIPPATPSGAARAMLRAASRSDTVSTVEDILADNGIAPSSGSPKTGPRP